MSLILKKKRESKTSTEQYELYLEEMETNEVFRTGTINPNLPPDYIDTVWKQLAIRLNSCDSGPVLEWNIWKTRFVNWKNSTRAKYRSKVMDIKKTGGGSGLDIKLNSLEERGLNVWGRVTVTGCTKVPVSGGLQQYFMVPPSSNEDNTSNETQVPNTIIIEEVTELVDEEIAASFATEAVDEVVLNDVATDNNSLIVTPVKLRNNISSSLKRKHAVPHSMLRPNSKPTITESRTIKTIGEELLNIYKNKNSFTNNSYEEQKINLEQNKLRFEVAKYKYEHPDFCFEL